MATKTFAIVWRWACATWPMLFLAFYLAAHAAYPFSYYYNVGEIYVDPNPAKQGDVRLRYNGGARVDFIGKYSVIVRKFDDHSIACDASSAPFMYETKSKRPAPLTMQWWAPSDARCFNLPAGLYSMETCWTVTNRGWRGLLPDVRDCIETEIFRVTG